MGPGSAVHRYRAAPRPDTRAEMLAHSVAPAKAGAHNHRSGIWVPACAGTNPGLRFAPSGLRLLVSSCGWFVFSINNGSSRRLKLLFKLSQKPSDFIFFRLVIAVIPKVASKLLIQFSGFIVFIANWIVDFLSKHLCSNLNASARLVKLEKCILNLATKNGHALRLDLPNLVKKILVTLNSFECSVIRTAAIPFVLSFSLPLGHVRPLITMSHYATNMLKDKLRLVRKRERQKLYLFFFLPAFHASIGRMYEIQKMQLRLSTLIRLLSEFESHPNAHGSATFYLPTNLPKNSGVGCPSGVIPNFDCISRILSRRSKSIMPCVFDTL